MITPVSDADLAALHAQLGRPARGVVGIAARCVCGNPTVVQTAPRLPDGTPFPTLYYLTHPGAVAAVSTLEATGTMRTMQERLGTDEELAAAYRAAHERYLEERYALEDVPEIHGISAGGMPDRVKCLHVLAGYALAAGPGVNPLGDEVLELIKDRWRPDRCTCDVPAASAPDAGVDTAAEQAAGPETSSSTVRVAAIDCGTNSIRLLIADVDSATGTLTDVTRRMTVVRLGQGVDKTGEFAAEALERTFAATDEYAQACRDAGVERIRFVATSATRDARNRDVFLEGIRERLGVTPEVISGTEEAELSFRGAASVSSSLEGVHAPFLVVDLGGGSTELVLGSDGPEAAHSMDVGCVRMTERHLVSDPPSPEQIAAATADIHAAIDAASQEVPLGRVGTLIGLAGSVTTVTAHALRLDQYRPDAIHGAVLSIDDAIAACTELIEMTREERAALPFMHPGRIDVIGAGALVWRTVLMRVQEAARAAGGDLATVVTSEHDILDGIALSLA